MNPEVVSIKVKSGMPCGLALGAITAIYPNARVVFIADKEKAKP